METFFFLIRSEQRSVIDEDAEREEENEQVSTRPASPTKAIPCSSNSSSAEEIKSDSAPPQIQAYPPPPPPSLLASIGNSLNQQQMADAAPGLAYPRPIHPALMLEAMNFHHRMMPDGRPPYANFLSGHHHHLLPR